MAVDQMTVDFLKRLEGFNPHAYNDHKQVSIGYGTRAQRGETSITRAEAEQRLRDEAEKPAALIERFIPGIDPARKAALISFGYNLGTGEGGLADLLPDAAAGNWGRVAQRMQRYVHASGQVNEGLVNRRAKEAALIAGGEMPRNQMLAGRLKERVSGGTTQDSATVSPEELKGSTGSASKDKLNVGVAKDYRGGRYKELSDALMKQNEMLLARPTNWAQPLAAMVNAGLAGYYSNKDAALGEKPPTPEAQMKMAKMAAEIQKLQADAAKPIVVKQRDQWGREAEVLVDPRTGRQVGLQAGEGDHLIQTDQAVTPQRAQVAHSVVQRMNGGQQPAPQQQQTATTPQRTAEGFQLPQAPNYSAPVQQPAQQAVPSQQPMQPLPSGAVVGPAADSKVIGEGYMQRTAPNGGFLWRQTDAGLVPDVMPKVEFEAAARAREQAAVKKEAGKVDETGATKFLLDTLYGARGDLRNLSQQIAYNPGVVGGKSKVNLAQDYLEARKSGNPIDAGITAAVRGMTDQATWNTASALDSLKSKLGALNYGEIRKLFTAGSLTEGEWKIFQNLTTSFNPAQDAETLQKNIAYADSLLTKIGDRTQSNYQNRYGEKLDWEPTTPPIDIPSVRSKDPYWVSRAYDPTIQHERVSGDGMFIPDYDITPPGEGYRDVGRTVLNVDLGLPDQLQTSDGSFKRYQPQHSTLGSLLGSISTDEVDRRMHTVAPPQIEAPADDINKMDALRNAMMKANVTIGDQSTPKSDMLPEGTASPLPAIEAPKTQLDDLAAAKASLMGQQPSDPSQAITDTLKAAGYDDEWITNYLTSMGYGSNYAMNGGY